MEMRSELRYRLNARAFFCWEGLDHDRMRGEGITRDLSVLSAFVRTPTCPPVGAPVQMELVLYFAGMKSPIRLGGQGRVIRVDHPSEGPGENGFAVVRDEPNQWSLRPNQDGSDAREAAEFSLSANVEMEREES